jgi:hypothetical protein
MRRDRGVLPPVCWHEKPPGGCGEPGFQLLAGHLVRELYPLMKLLYLFACGALAM